MTASAHLRYHEQTGPRSDPGVDTSDHGSGGSAARRFSPVSEQNSARFFERKELERKHLLLPAEMGKGNCWLE
jgi:hypothetical protein